MEQVNMGLPENQEENKLAAVISTEEKRKSPLLEKVNQKFVIFGGISLIFGAFFTILFYDAGVGLNVLLFTLIMIGLLYLVIKTLNLSVKNGTKLYFVASALLGLSSTLTSSGILLFLNVLGILLLFDLALLNQFYEDRQWSFTKHFFRMIGFLFQAIASIGMPFVDCVNYMKHTRVFKNDKARNVFLGLLISIPILWIILALLSNADLLFGELTKDIFDLVFSEDIIVIVIMFIFGVLASYCIICAAVTNVGKEEKKEIKKADASIAATVMVMLCLVYAVFCVIQVIYLFSNLFVLPEQFTFADYARRGFFELLTVTIINILLMLISKELFKESKLLRFLLTFMTACTYIMIASATYRMLLYIGAYHLTFLRVFVLLSLLIIALILAGVIISEYKKDFQLFRYCVMVISICYIVFSFSRPDYYIAAYLIDHENRLEYEDMSYLTYELSLDAAPLVLPLITDQERWTFESTSKTDDYEYERSMYWNDPEDMIQNYYDEIKTAGGDFRGFNYSSYRAKIILKGNSD